MANSEFLEHKQTFFSSENMQSQEYSNLLSKESYLLSEENRFEADEKAEGIELFPHRSPLRLDYNFLLKNQRLLETEFTEMFTILKKQRNCSDRNQEAFWFYCYYCALLLEEFHKIYSQESKAKEYKAFREEIRSRCRLARGEVFEAKNNNDDNFIQTIKNAFIEGFHSILKLPTQISQVRDYVGYANLCRIYWIFTRLTLTQALTLANDMKLIEKLDALLGTHTDVNKIIKTFRSTIGVMNFFSVGFFLARFIIDGAMLLSHTFSRKLDERNSNRYERFKYEFKKRHCNFANDIVWSTVNFLTNYSQITHISSVVASNITAVFLLFDICMTLYKRRLEEQAYEVKKEEYKSEQKQLWQQFKQENRPIDPDDLRLERIQFIDKLLQEHELNWNVKKATFDFLAVAASLLLFGFTCSIVANPAIAIMGCYFICTLGVAIYFSSDSYSKFEEKSLRLAQVEKEEPNFEDNKKLIFTKEYYLARNDFIFTMIKNATMPMVLITAFSISWPAAVALTLLYLGSEINRAYGQYTEKKIIKTLSENIPDVMIEEGALRSSFSAV